MDAQDVIQLHYAIHQGNEKNSTDRQQATRSTQTSGERNDSLEKKKRRNIND